MWYPTIAVTTVCPNLAHDFSDFQDYPLNPKALSLGELYGEFDLNTNEWTDGVLSSVMRQTCAGIANSLMSVSGIN